MITFDEYLRRMNNIEKKDVLNGAMEYLFGNILLAISKLQVPDTTYARALIIKEMANKLNLNIQDVRKEAYYYWENNGYPGNKSRRWSRVSQGNYAYDTGMSFYNERGQITREEVGGTYYIYYNKKHFRWQSDDHAIYLQESGDRNASKNVDGRGSNYPKKHITLVCNRFNNNKYYDVYKQVDKIIEKAIEDYLK